MRLPRDGWPDPRARRVIRVATSQARPRVARGRCRQQLARDQRRPLVEFPRYWYTGAPFQFLLVRTMSRCSARLSNELLNNADITFVWQPTEDQLKGSRRYSSRHRGSCPRLHPTPMRGSDSLKLPTEEIAVPHLRHPSDLREGEVVIVDQQIGRRDFCRPVPTRSHRFANPSRVQPVVAAGACRQSCRRDRVRRDGRSVGATPSGC